MDTPYDHECAISTSNPNGSPTHERPRILTLFESAAAENRPLLICAPMVRYSKLPFRLLLTQHYSTDVVFTPMMLAHEFTRSAIARDSDFTTHPLERSSSAHALIAQFAACSPLDLCRACELIAPYVDGVDLNCGCPQSWALKEGIGCSLMGDAEKVAELVRAMREAVGAGKSVSVKIRVHKDLQVTKKWLDVVVAAGVDFITVHGRTRAQRSSTPPDYEAIRELKKWVKVPVVANGDAFSYKGVRAIAERTGADGVMAARGILENPAMGVEGEVEVGECVRVFIEWAVKCPIPYALVQHHVGEMIAKEGRRERRRLMECEDMLDLLDYVEERWGRRDG